MARKTHNKGLLAMCCLVGLSGTAYAATAVQPLPKASSADAQITHWRMPDSDKRFMDISELSKPYISSAPTNLGDGIAVGALSAKDSKALTVLAQEIAQGKHGNYDSLLISQHGKLLFESYYKRGRVDLSHPQSSATKSYTSVALGRAIQMGYLSMDDLDKPVISFLGDVDTSKLVPGADKVTLHHALTMTTGIQIPQEGWQALEKDLQRVNGQGEVQAIFEDSAPITKQTQVFEYGTGPQLIMQVIEAKVPGSAKDFIANEVFGKLGITNYSWCTAPSGLPESGWKVSVTARDMLKVGHLAMNNGRWQGEQLLPAAYVKKATTRQVIVGDDDVFGGGELVSNQGYGYFWWSTDLAHGNTAYHAASAQGGGGMYILLIRDLDLTLVVTAHERDDTTQQLTAERILPLFVAKG